MRRAPAHAGRLRPWERSVFALVFALMMAFVVTITLSAGKQGGPTPVPAGLAVRSQPAGGGAGQAAAAPAATGSVEQTSTGAVPTTVQVSAQLSKRLAAALAPILKRHRVGLAVGVIDESTGTEAVFRGGRKFRAAGLAAADLVAALLLQHQRAARPVSVTESDQAAAMIQHGSSSSAAAMWLHLRAGFNAANTALRMTHTQAGHGVRWSQLRTTVADQLQLLTDLSSVTSPLDSAYRDYLLGLMNGVAPGQSWGVPAAASSGTRYAVKNGWLADSGSWVINSAGVVECGGQELLIAVLSDGSPSKARGVSLVRSAALAAAGAVTGSS